MDQARLIVPRPEGSKVVPVTQFPFRIGRHHENELKLEEADVSRHHAQIIKEGERFVLADAGSRFGTYLNGARIERDFLAHGDQIHLGSTSHPALEFQMVADELNTGVIELERALNFQTMAPGAAPSSTATAAVTASAGPKVGMELLGQALRAMVEGRVLEEVLAIVVDHAIQLSGAERGFVSLTRPNGELEVRMARGKRGQTLPGREFQLSQKIPRLVLETGKVAHENDVPEGRDTQVNLKIRSILCAPLPRVRSLGYETGDVAAQSVSRLPMGVLYVDSAGLGRLESPELHAAFEQLAAEAAVAIENARLVKEAEAKIKLEREMEVAAEIQKGLLPPERLAVGGIELFGRTLPCRSIGGDFYEYASLPEGRVAFSLCDVSGKGPGAALLAAAIQGILAYSSHTMDSPPEILRALNHTLVQRNLERKFATIAYGTIDSSGHLRLTSAGHNPSYLLRADGRFEKLHKGGLMVGIFPELSYDEDLLQLEPGDTLLLYSDGVTEAEDAAQQQFEEPRLEECLAQTARNAPDLLVSSVFDAVQAFAGDTTQADDITVLAIRYNGAAAPAA